METMNIGWTISIGANTYENVSNDTWNRLARQKLKKNEHVTMSVTLPDLGNIPFPVILYKSKFSTFTAYLDGKEIYSFAEDEYKEGKFIGKLNHMITLPNDYAGKVFLADIYIAENNCYLPPMAPIMGSQPDVEGDLISKNIQPFTTGLFLIAFGLSFLCISLFFVTSDPETMTLMFSSMFCMLLGIWLLCYYNLLSLLMFLPYETTVEYLVSYALPPFYFILLHRLQKIKHQRIFFTIAGTSCFITLFLYFLHFALGIHLRDTLALHNANSVVALAMVLYFFIRNIRQKNISKAEMTQMAGLFTLVVTMLFHYSLYVFGGLRVPISFPLERQIMSFGFILFAVFQLSNYLVNITEAYATRLENASLTHLAYADGLTNLANRARSDNVMKNLDNGDDDYCIISIDLNGLKPVNDKYGHLAGDKYIKDFAKVLTNTFGEETFTARIGGDEFLVVIKDSSVVDVGLLIGRMNSALNVMNALYPDYHRSVATGYAFKHECPDQTSHEVYLLADERMYELKRKMHEELGIHPRL
jgi:diguanylate cyclase (GGDEF)-like protein